MLHTPVISMGQPVNLESISPDQIRFSIDVWRVFSIIDLFLDSVRFSNISSLLEDNWYRVTGDSLLPPYSDKNNINQNLKWM